MMEKETTLSPLEVYQAARVVCDFNETETIFKGCREIILEGKSLKDANVCLYIPKNVNESQHPSVLLEAVTYIIRGDIGFLKQLRNAVRNSHA